MIKTRFTEAEIFEAYRIANQLSDTEFARELQVSKGRLSHWMNARHYPPLEWLTVTAREFTGKWQSDLAVYILRKRGNEDDIPCVCEDVIGDNGPCPKHGAAVAEVNK